MKAVNHNLSIIAGFLLIPLFLISCEKDKNDGNKYTPEEKENIKVSEWIFENMQPLYYWNSTFAANIDPSKETDPKAFFNELVYEEEDKWSYITDDYEDLQSQLSGTPVSMGYSPSFYLLGNTSQVFIVVEYVYPGSPADIAGLRRGDIIMAINSVFLDTSNYYDLFIQESYTARLGAVSGNEISITDETVAMTAASFNADPLVFDTIMDVSESKIGYMVYTGFLPGDDEEYIASLRSVLNNFKTQGISELIVDLRYNQGGYIDVSGFLASSIAPQNVVNSEEVFTRFLYNDMLQEYFEETEGTESPNLIYKFEPNTNNLNLDRVFFLTTNRTASASELLMIGLEPYMPVTIIGEPSYGKYTGSMVITDENEPKEHNWAIMPIILKYANSEGFTDFVDGIAPDFRINDDPVKSGHFGNTNDPMLAKAIEQITGMVKKSTLHGNKFGYHRFDSKVDKLKRNLFIKRQSVSE